jgi:curli biogenesis system outer membrane secretion channel CsgG
MRAGLHIILLLLGLCGVARAELVHVDAEGVGPTRESAIGKALASAIEQATGVTIDVAQFSGMTAASVTTDISHGTQMIQTTQDSIRRVAGGIVRSYRITSIAPAPEGGFLAEIGVEVEVFRAVGLGSKNRRRIAVARFNEQGVQGAGSQLRDSLLAYLTQTRRFAVIDRASDAAYEREMAVATGAAAAPAERVRAGQVIAADYIVTGTVHMVVSRTLEQTLELTGERIQQTIAGSASADFQVIEIATRQIKWAGKIMLPGGAGAETIAARIGEEITQAIYPMRLIKFDDPNRLIVNEGGMGIKPGQRFRAMLLGQGLEDPYTHEPLGQAEQEIGVIEINDVQPKLSYAHLVSGRLPDANQQIVLRPGARAGASLPRHTRASPAPKEQGGGTRLPFDR